MSWTAFDDWFTRAPLVMLGGLVVGLMAVAAIAGGMLRARHSRGDGAGAAASEGQDGYLVSSVLGLLALLMGFTFALAVDRYDTRRALVLEEANAIGTTYLRTQLLAEPHRSRISALLIDYADNRLALSRSPATPNSPLLLKNDRLITDLWAATSAAFVTIKGLDFSSSYLETMNNLIDLDASRKAARMVRVPATVLAVLVVYLVVTSGVLGYVLVGPRGRFSAGLTLTLLALSLLLIMDIDSPMRGTIRERQGPMEALDRFLKTQPPATFDKWLRPPPP